MIAMALSEAAQVVRGRLQGADTRFAGLSTDSRGLERGNLFVALAGERFDGHDYLDQAAAGGAAGALVSTAVTELLPCIRVTDTRLALGGLAAAWRARFDIPLVAVTGSNGKTTVKEMLAAILGMKHQVLATRGNLNNDIGVPLTLGRLDAVHTAAVIEMGANHPGEIAYLTGLARPTVALITNAGPAHLEGFGSLEGVARAKAEIYDGLGPEGLAVVNRDDAFADYWLMRLQGRRIMTFGLEMQADVSAEVSPHESGQRLVLRTPAGSIEVELALPGRHNAMNALAAVAAALGAGASLAAVQSGLQSLRPVGGRLQIHRCADDIGVIDDTYNANPGSVQAALAVLGQLSGERWLVLGDMGELGGESRQLHRDIGARAAAAGCDRLFTLGGDAASAAEAFTGPAAHFDDFESLQSALEAQLHPGVQVLVKGSRSMRMERVVQALLVRLQPRPGGRH
ncbi:UDP-N-acetylmuramoyl-tripeptide--D-alanyl-D-alanine ligase [Thiohalobacter sp. COW1]|uniref:UDP-N-acetylmuramoyl-tripeptide--D-alanyl-D- alanine ligase n=1 Tax=Thiohalobacter sp. COW1 TaxID=2795687 RepID=UPI00193670F0|nr:UDP-N-acetylmuramoyl-tripeptide--D-alanyl-D-alanine ligase [Thiohalobacter sp. COW1]BCO33041.1 UDP-N-acetylmuramoyl-tripeptide--D-alanyl-D-alanine ligase [Thiohalobacter sp. COW1]